MVDESIQMRYPFLFLKKIPWCWWWPSFLVQWWVSNVLFKIY